MEFETIQLTFSDGRADLALNRPDKLNALSLTTLRELAEAAGQIGARSGIKVVVISGKGRAFCAGADLGGLRGESAGGSGGVAAARAAADAGRLMAESIEGIGAVTIARIHGHCVGGGVVMASACDLRLAGAGTRFSIPEVDLGIPLTWGGIPRLVREIGPALTKELVMTCRAFSAEEALGFGFLNRVVSADSLDREVDELASQLEGKSSLALLSTKAHVNAVTDGMVSPARAWNDADSLVVAQRDPESRAAAAAYLQRLGKPARPS